ncbi:MAG: hypothetical protein ACRC4M_04560 [Mycoplasma sp.]
MNKTFKTKIKKSLKQSGFTLGIGLITFGSLISLFSLGGVKLIEANEINSSIELKENINVEVNLEQEDKFKEVVSFGIGNSNWMELYDKNGNSFYKDNELTELRTYLKGYNNHDGFYESKNNVDPELVSERFLIYLKTESLTIFEKVWEEELSNKFIDNVKDYRDTRKEHVRTQSKSTLMFIVGGICLMVSTITLWIGIVEFHENWNY